MKCWSPCTSWLLKLASRLGEPVNFAEPKLRLSSARFPNEPSRAEPAASQASYRASSILSSPILTPMNTCTQPYPYEHLQETKSGDLETDKVTAGASQSTGMSPTTERVMPVKSWNKFRKMWTPVLTRGLEPGWAGSTAKTLTGSH